MSDMDHFFDVFKRQTLSSSERESIKTRVRLFMAAHPPRIPWYIRFADNIMNTRSAGDSRKLFGLSARPFAYAFALFLCVGIGTTYASETALPGDVLYPVKIQVRERMQAALAVSTEEKVAWSARVITRRLEEAESLAAQGRLTPAVSAEIESQLDVSADNFDTHIATLAQTPDDDVPIADAQSNLEISLSAHEHLLSKLSDELPAAKAAIEPVLSSVRTHGARAKEARIQAEIPSEASGEARETKRAKENTPHPDGKIRAEKD